MEEQFKTMILRGREKQWPKELATHRAKEATKGMSDSSYKAWFGKTGNFCL
jgi:hypothetical protein